MQAGADTMMELSAEVACRVGATLGEGPVWIPQEQALWFVDIKQSKLHRFTPDSGALDSWNAPAQPGWILPDASGGLICGLQSGLSRFDRHSETFTHLGDVEPEFPGNRLNDATVDSHGRIWFGSMDDGESQSTGSFFRADARGIARVISGIAITNGPAANCSGDLLYHTDTLAGTISVSRIADDGALYDTRLFVQIDPADGYPDGPIVDGEDCVWTGLWGGWSARRYSPSGELLTVVRYPAANITKLAFGGSDGRTVYATSASKGLSERELANQPNAGDLFSFSADVAGQEYCPIGEIMVQRVAD